MVYRRDYAVTNAFTNAVGNLLPNFSTAAANLFITNSPPRVIITVVATNIKYCLHLPQNTI
jgi:hypothetical protein